MPLSQAISDTDCIMRDYNQLTAAGSYGERMILNRNQYKLNLTLSPTEQSSELETREGSRDRSGAFRVGQRVLGKPPQQPGDLPDVPLPSGGRLELPSPSLPSLCLPYLPFLSCLLLPLVSGRWGWVFPKPRLSSSAGSDPVAPSSPCLPQPHQQPLEITQRWQMSCGGEKPLRERKGMCPVTGIGSGW